MLRTPRMVFFLQNRTQKYSNVLKSTQKYAHLHLPSESKMPQIASRGVHPGFHHLISGWILTSDALFQVEHAASQGQVAVRCLKTRTRCGISDAPDQTLPIIPDLTDHHQRSIVRKEVSMDSNRNVDININRGSVAETLSRNWWLLALRGLAAVLFGVLTFIWPGITLLTLIFLFGAYAIVNGVLSFIVAYHTPREHGRVGSLILHGILSVAA